MSVVPLFCGYGTVNSRFINSFTRWRDNETKVPPLTSQTKLALTLTLTLTDTVTLTLTLNLTLTLLNNYTTRLLNYFSYTQLSIRQREDMNHLSLKERYL